MRENTSDLCNAQIDAYIAFRERIKREGVKDSETLRRILNGDVHIRPLPLANGESNALMVNREELYERCARSDRYKAFDDQRGECAEIFQLSLERFRPFVLSFSLPTDRHRLSDCCEAFDLELPRGYITMHWLLMQVLGAPDLRVDCLIMPEVKASFHDKLSLVACMRFSPEPVLDAIPEEETWPAGTKVLAYRTIA